VWSEGPPHISARPPERANPTASRRHKRHLIRPNVKRGTSLLQVTLVFGIPLHSTICEVFWDEVLQESATGAGSWFVHGDITSETGKPFWARFSSIGTTGKRCIYMVGSKWKSHNYRMNVNRVRDKVSMHQPTVYRPTKTNRLANVAQQVSQPRVARVSSW